MKERASRNTPFSTYWEKKFAEDRERARKKNQTNVKPYPMHYQYHFIGK
jgi:hypothetical protein